MVSTPPESRLPHNLQPSRLKVSAVFSLIAHRAQPHLLFSELSNVSSESLCERNHFGQRLVKSRSYTQTSSHATIFDHGVSQVRSSFEGGSNGTITFGSGHP